MKFLYVLASDASDTYLEQALLSITSARLKIPNAFISLLTDETTLATLHGSRNKILELVDETKSIKISGNLNKKARSRWLKISMRDHIEGDFLFFDCDTIITDTVSDTDFDSVEIGAVLNAHAYLDDLERYHPVYLSDIREKDKKLGFASSFKSNLHFNSGVLYCKDSPMTHDFFKEWYKLWLYCFEKNSLTDQQSFNQANYIRGNVITELDGKWNCQILSEGAINYLHNAKIIHYFAEMPVKKPYILGNRDVLESIKEKGGVDQNIINLLSNSKGLFAQHTRLVLMDKKLRKFHNSVIFAITKWLFYSPIGTAIEFILSGIRKKILKPLKAQYRKNNQK